MTSRPARGLALLGGAALLAAGLSGCVPGAPAPECSEEVQQGLASASTTIIHEFPAPELLVGGGILCWVAFQGEGEAGTAGLAFFEGADGDDAAIARLEGNGFETDPMLPEYYRKGDLFAAVTPSDGPLQAEDEPPAEFVGKELAILYVGPQ